MPGLEATSVATTLTSTVPMWPSARCTGRTASSTTYEGHSSAGATATAQAWAVAAGENGGSDNAQTFVLIANTANTAGEATVTVLPDRSASQAVTPMVLALPANSRTTVPITSVNGTFGVLVQSTGGSPVPLVVESAVYRTPSGSPIGPQARTRWAPRCPDASADAVSHRGAEPTWLGPSCFRFLSRRPSVYNQGFPLPTP